MQYARSQRVQSPHLIIPRQMIEKRIILSEQVAELQNSQKKMVLRYIIESFHSRNLGGNVNTRY